MPSTTSATDSLESTLCWAGEGFEQSWALYAVPDGLIAATSVQRNGEGPPGVVVTRTGAAHRGAGYSRRRNPFPTAAAAELPRCGQ